MQSHELWRNLGGKCADFHTWKNLKVAGSTVMGRPPDKEMHFILPVQLYSKQGTSQRSGR